MKYTNAKYIAAVVTTSGIALTSIAGTCFALGDTKTAPVYLTAPATSIDFTISTGSAAGTHTGTNGENAIYIEQTNGASNAATVTNIVITNNVQTAPISVRKIKVTAVDSNYELVSYGRDFSEYAINSKKYALAINNAPDGNLSPVFDLTSDYETNDLVTANGGTVTYGLTGKVSASSTAVSNAHIANVVVTVSE